MTFLPLEDFDLTEQPELPEWARTLAVFDTETTGVDVDEARIVSAHLGILDADGSLVERWDWLANPGVEIPLGASAVHGISTERAIAEGRPAQQVVAEIMAAIAGVVDRRIPLVVYNAPYDLTLLDREAQRHGLAPLASYGVVIDPLIIDKEVDRYRKGKRTLELASEFYGVSLVGAHDAGADALAAGLVAQRIARKYSTELPATAAELHRAQIGWALSQAENFTVYMRANHDPNFTASGAWPQR